MNSSDRAAEKTILSIMGAVDQERGYGFVMKATEPGGILRWLAMTGTFKMPVDWQQKPGIGHSTRSAS